MTSRWAAWCARTVEPEGIQSADPEGVVLDALARPDLERYQQQLRLSTILARTTSSSSSQDPAAAELPAPLASARARRGPAPLSYSVQWFIFATIGIIGYPLTLRRIAHSPKAEDGRHSDIPVDYL